MSFGVSRDTQRAGQLMPAEALRCQKLPAGASSQREQQAEAEALGHSRQGS